MRYMSRQSRPSGHNPFQNPETCKSVFILSLIAHSFCYFLVCFLRYLFCTEDGVSQFLRNVCKLIPDYMVSQPRILQSSHSYCLRTSKTHKQSIPIYEWKKRCWSPKKEMGRWSRNRKIPYALKRRRWRSIPAMKLTVRLISFLNISDMFTHAALLADGD
jgi:hypothetical protein